MELPLEVRDVFHAFSDIFSALPGVLQASIIAGVVTMCFFAIIKLYL
jgi:hypothetical protein